MRSRRLPALHTAGGGLQLEQACGAGPANVRLWAQLLPLAALDATGSEGTAAAATVAAATGGYPWRHLQQPAHSIAVPAPSTDCSCSPRKQQSGWFSWLRWGRHEAMPPTEPLRELAASSTAMVGGPCACAGGCSDADCCCHVSMGRSEGAAEHWGGPLHAGTAADSSGWEAGWRGSAAGGANSAPLLCGPGSMQILPPRHALPAAARSASAAHVQQQQQQQEGDGEVTLLPAQAQAEQHEQQPAHQQEQQQQIVVDEALIEVVLGPRRYEGHHAAGGSGMASCGAAVLPARLPAWRLHVALPPSAPPSSTLAPIPDAPCPHPVPFCRARGCAWLRCRPGVDRGGRQGRRPACKQSSSRAGAGSLCLAPALHLRSPPPTTCLCRLLMVCTLRRAGAIH